MGRLLKPDECWKRYHELGLDRATRATIAGAGCGAGFGARRAWNPLLFGSALQTWYDVSAASTISLRATSLANGGFDADASWTKANWTISGGAARITGGAGTISQSSVGVVGDTYKTVVVVSTLSAGTLNVKWGTTVSADITTPGTYTFTNVFAGTTTFTIEATGNTTAVVDSVTCDPQHVSQLSDQTSNARHLTQGTASKQPVYQPTGWGSSKPCFAFNGSSHYLTTSAFTLNQPYTHIFVANCHQTAAKQDITAWTSSENGFSVTTNKLYMYSGATLSATGSNQPNTDTGYVYEMFFNGSSSALALNNQTRTTGNAGTAAMDKLVLGAYSAGTAYWTQMSFVEMMIINRDFTDASERSSCIAYLRSKWGV